MRCSTCGTDFTGASCPRCGRMASGYDDAPPEPIGPTGSAEFNLPPQAAPQMMSAGGLATAFGGSGVVQSPGGFQSVGAGVTGAADAVAMSLKAGDVIAGRYEVRAQLGAGGMGAVYKCLDRVRNVEVALKAMLPSLLLSPKAVERFRSEAEISLQLAHDNIVRVNDVHHDQERGLRFYTMELLQGESLRAWLHAKKQKGEPVKLEEATEIMRQLLEALKVAHRVTIHRDLKPENIFMLKGKEIHIKVVDFGIAKVQAGSDGQAGPAGGGMTMGGLALGTAYYMAPEQQLDAGSVDRRADMYSASVVFYEMLTGKLPVGRFRVPSEERKDLPVEIDELILHGLDPDPANRIADANEYLAALSRVKAGQAAGTRRGGGGRGGKTGLIAAGVLVLGIAGALAVTRPWEPKTGGTGGSKGASGGTIALASTGATAGAGASAGTGPTAGTGTGGTTGPSTGATAAFTGPSTGPSVAVFVPPPDTRKPVLKILSPIASFVTNRDRIEVRGTAEDESLDSVLVQGKPVTGDASSFIEDVPLEIEGKNTIQVVAKDKAGNDTVQTVTVIRDTEKPRLRVDRPSESELKTPTRESDIVLEGTVSDRTLDRLLIGDDPVTPEGSGAFQYRWKLSEGENRLLIVATDGPKHRSELLLRATRDTTAPRVTLTPGQPDRDGRVVLRGTLSEPGCTVEVAGSPVTVAGTTFEHTLQLSPGETRIEAVARDAAGNVGKAESGPVVVKARPTMRPGPKPNTFVNEKDGSLMVKVPGGKFRMGADGDEADDDEKPPHEVELSPYYLDVYEVTVRQFGEFVKDMRYVTDAERAGRSETWKKNSLKQRDNHPVVFVSWNDAAAYAEWAGKRLPTEAEWERAACWDAAKAEKWRFPWGKAEPPGMGDRPPTNIADLTAEQRAGLPQGAGFPGYDDGFGSTSQVDAFDRFPSPAGACDMGGNVSEWCVNWYDPEFYKTLPDVAKDPRGPASGEERVYRGAAWDSKLYLRATARRSNTPQSFARSLGFRCAKSE